MIRSAFTGARRALSTAAASSPPKKVAVTGAAGSIGYALLMRIASGEMLGIDQPVELQLLETETGMKPLRGVVMELQDGAFPLVEKISATSDSNQAFGDADIALLVGARPRTGKMERSDLLSMNAAIFAEQGRALNESAKRSVSVLVVGNPANTNALIASAHAPDISPSQFMAMTRLDQNRAMAQVALKAGVSVADVDRVVIWGNHSSTQYPDLSHARIKGQPALSVVDDTAWMRNEFIPRVQKRGAEIIGAMGKSSAASAASAAIDHMRDLTVGSGNTWQSMAVPSDGSYGIDKDIWYSVPVQCTGNGVYERVLDIPSPDEFSAAMMDATRKELLEERDAVRDLLPGGGGSGGGSGGSGGDDVEKSTAKTTRKRRAKKATA